MLRSALLAFTRGRKVPRTGYTVLTSKRGPRDFYKGKGAQPTGKHTRKGLLLSSDMFRACFTCLLLFKLLGGCAFFSLPGALQVGTDWVGSQLLCGLRFLGQDATGSH